MLTLRRVAGMLAATTLACSSEDPDPSASEPGDAANDSGASEPRVDASAEVAPDAGEPGEAGPPVRLRIFVRNLATGAGEPGDAGASLDAGSAIPVILSPGVFWTHGPGRSLFETEAPASAGLERLAEDGAFEDLLREVEASGVGTAGFFGADDVGSSYDESPLMPGQSADFVVEVQPGDRLEVAMMWAQSNDVFVATAPGGLELFQSDAPRLGARASALGLYDAGTEVNQPPGRGPDQAPRQAAPNTGAEEGGVVTPLESDVDSAGFAYPPLMSTVELEVTLDEAAPSP